MDTFIKGIEKLALVCGIVIFLGILGFIMYLFIPGKWLLLHQVKTWEQIPFQREQWLEAGKEDRGKMIKSLMETQSFESMNRTTIEEFLGESNLYCGNDAMACYEVSHEDISYELAFFPQNSNSVNISLSKHD